MLALVLVVKGTPCQKVAKAVDARQDKKRISDCCAAGLGITAGASSVSTPQVCTLKQNHLI
jgi:hypothetical protein